jgi:ketosteroid isomerase-like protein
MRRIILPVVAAFLFCAPTFANAQTDQQVADEVIAITKAEWEAQIARQPVAASMSHIADEYTQFSPPFPILLDGKDMVMRIAEVGQTSTVELVSAEMVNPKVQVYGDVAVLTYNFIGQTRDSDGEVEPNLAKSSRVYVKQGGEWKLVHANFAPVGNGD